MSTALIISRRRSAGAAPALVTLADLVSARCGELALAQVKGHTGHTLDEGADLLATRVGSSTWPQRFRWSRGRVIIEA